MNCKHCNAELEENFRLCPYCGEPVDEPEQPADAVEEIPDQEPYQAPEIVEEKKTSSGKIALAIVAVVVVLAVLVAVIVGGMGGNNPLSGDDATIAPTSGVWDENTEVTEGTIPPDGNPDDVTCKGTYTVSDDEAVAAADTVVATMGDRTLTVGQLQFYYWQEVNYFLQECSSYGSYFGMDGATYASYIGMNYTQPLDTQMCAIGDTEMTWQQYFLACAIDTWISNQAMELEAAENEFVLSEQTRLELEELPAGLEETAAGYGIADAEELLRVNFGAAATVERYVDFWELYYTGYEYYTAQCELIQPTAEEVEAYFAENEETYAESDVTRDSGKYVDVRHILLMPEGGTTDEETGETTYSEEEWEACRVKAQEILDQWLAGEATEDTFAALANEKSEDGGSNTVGGLYENVYVGQMVEPFENWCFDEVRQIGDYGLVQTEYGYHIMYFVGSEDIWFVTAERDLLNERTSALVPAAIEKHPYEIDYSAIKLALVEMG